MPAFLFQFVFPLLMIVKMRLICDSDPHDGLDNDLENGRNGKEGIDSTTTTTTDSIISASNGLHTHRMSHQIS